MDLTKLSHRRERFAQEFVKDLNQTKAAARAGYKHPGVKGSQLMAIPVVNARISELQAAVAQRNEITVDSIAAQLDEDRALAYREGQAGAAVQASTKKGQLGGLFVERYAEESGAVDANAAIKELAQDSVLAEQALQLLFAGEVQRFERFVRSGGKLVPELVRVVN